MPNLTEELFPALDVGVREKAGVQKVMMVHLLASMSVWIFEVVVKLFPHCLLASFVTTRRKPIILYDLDTISIPWPLITARF